MVRIDQAMQNIRNLRPSSFTVTELDDELQSMAMIRALPADYQSFRSSLMLLDKIDKSTLQAAFKNEEIQRLQSQNLSSSSTTQALATSSASSLASTTSQRHSQFKCDFCGRLGHTINRCYAFAKAQKQAQKQAEQPKDSA